jgi:plastocyanin
VTVVNSDGAEHSVTADSGSAFNVEVDGKGTATFTAPTQPGTYAYRCTYHPSMHGQLIVQ